MSNLKILGIGNALVDIMVLSEDDQIINYLNLPKGGMTLVDGELSSRIQKEISHMNIKIATGGSVANAINGIAGLDVECGFVGAIGRDDLGLLFKNDMLKRGIEVMLKENELPTGRAVGFVSPGGERTFATYLGAAVEMGPEDITPELFAGYDLFFIEGYLVFNQPLIMAAASAAKLAGLTVALDLASYNVVDANLDILNELVDNYIDIVFANEEEAKSFTGLQPEAALENLARRCDIAVVKVGKEGAFVQQGDQKLHIPAIGTAVVDTTGAGDFFAAGFLAGLAIGCDLGKCGIIGSLMAGEVIQVIGAELEDSRWAELKKRVELI
ncbi:MAG TPA: adenosine kinase [Prolixibacteraceae bacterium]|jgi:sugar/nucleoside kinase (ribokinase family)